MDICHLDDRLITSESYYLLLRFHWNLTRANLTESMLLFKFFFPKWILIRSYKLKQIKITRFDILQCINALKLLNRRKQHKIQDYISLKLRNVFYIKFRYKKNWHVSFKSDVKKTRLLSMLSAAYIEHYTYIILLLYTTIYHLACTTQSRNVSVLKRDYEYRYLKIRN